MRTVVVFSLLVTLLGSSPPSTLAFPSDLEQCMTDLDVLSWCDDVFAGDFVSLECHRLFWLWKGHYAVWPPLQCVGPITVEVESFKFASDPTPVPVFVEIVPVRDGADRPCDNIPGYVVLVVHAAPNEVCGSWSHTGVIDITPVVPIGSLYCLRFYSLQRSLDDGIGLDCYRVISYPQAPTPVGTQSWGLVKSLFR